MFCENLIGTFEFKSLPGSFGPIGVSWNPSGSLGVPREFPACPCEKKWWNFFRNKISKKSFFFADYVLWKNLIGAVEFLGSVSKLGIPRGPSGSLGVPREIPACPFEKKWWKFFKNKMSKIFFRRLCFVRKSNSCRRVQSGSGVIPRSPSGSLTVPREFPVCPCEEKMTKFF